MPSLFKDLWQRDFGGLREQINDFVHDQLKDYLAEIGERRVAQPKTVHDAIWGNLTFTPAEMLIIDSPLLQRLRHIKHLGLASLLYPGAIHTRFEHTLGVTYLAEKIARRVQLRFDGVPVPDPIAQYCDSQEGKLDVVALIRIAALFHDAGHFFLSHAGEKALVSVRLQCHEKIVATLHSLNGVFPKEPQLGELLSALIVTAPATQMLLSHVYCTMIANVGGTAAPGQTENLAALAACFILGVAPNSPLTPFAGILSGTLDADKCDYLLRDSRYSGVPVAVDINRIVEKLTCIPMPLEAKRPFAYFTQPAPDSNGETVCDSLAIEAAAVRTIDDMLISRTLMYEKVYFHHKVLTAETMFIEGLRQLECWCPQLFADVGRLLNLSDGDFIGMSGLAGIRDFVQHHDLKTGDETFFLKARNIFFNLTLRHLYKRCCILTNNTLSAVPCCGQGVDQECVREFMQDVITLPVNGEKVAGFVDALTRQTLEIADILGLSQAKARLNDCGIIVAPNTGKTISEVNFTVATADGKGKKYNQMFNFESWQDGRLKLITQHLLLAPGPLRLAAHLATELVLYREYNILLPPEAYVACKITRHEYEEGKKILVDKGIYRNVPSLIDVASHLSPKETKIVYNIAAKFSRYQPRVFLDNEKTKDDPLVSPQQIFAFIAQFTPFKPDSLPHDQFFRAIVAVLGKVQLVTPLDMAANIGRLYASVKEQHTDLSQYPVFPLGNFQDSASHLAYYFEKTLKQNVGFSGIKPMSLLGAYLDGNKQTNTLVFYDDAYYSGKQTHSIFKTLLGLTPDYTNPHIEPLASQKQVNALKKKKFILLYGYGTEQGGQVLADELTALGLRPHVFQAACFPHKIFSAQADFENDAVLEAARGAFAAIGRQLLQPLAGADPVRWNDERVQRSGLGYDDAQQGIVFTWNTPVYTLTPLWRGGSVRANGSDTFEWFALFPRDEKRTIPS